MMIFPDFPIYSSLSEKKKQYQGYIYWNMHAIYCDHHLMFIQKYVIYGLSVKDWFLFFGAVLAP